MRSGSLLALALIASPALVASPALAAAEAGSPASPSPSAAAAPDAPIPDPNPCNDSRRIPANQRDILVCGERTNTYRLDPDILAARSAKRASNGGPKPRETMKRDDCSTVGPMGCRTGPTLDYIRVALTAAEIAKRLSQGREIGSMFKTTPNPSEYALYLQAKAEREEREEAQAADALVKLSKAEAKSPQNAAKPASTSPGETSAANPPRP